jgi:cytoskeleton protein RodZ
VPEVDLSMPASSGTDLPRGRVSIPLGSSSGHHPWLWGTAIVVVAVIAVLMWHTGGDSASWLARFKGAAAEHAPAASAVAASAASAAEEPAAGSASTAAGNEVVAASAVVAQASASVAASVAAPAAAAPASPASQPAAASAASTANAAEPASVAVAAGQSVVELKVKQDCWFSVRDKNGKELFSALVRAGETKQVAGDGPFKVTIGNKAGLDAVAFDGKPVDPAKYSAARGNVARFTLP